MRKVETSLKQRKVERMLESEFDMAVFRVRRRPVERYAVPSCNEGIDNWPKMPDDIVGIGR